VGRRQEMRECARTLPRNVLLALSPGGGQLFRGGQAGCLIPAHGCIVAVEGHLEVDHLALAAPVGRRFLGKAPGQGVVLAVKAKASIDHPLEVDDPLAHHQQIVLGKGIPHGCRGQPCPGGSLDGQGDGRKQAHPKHVGGHGKLLEGLDPALVAVFQVADIGGDAQLGLAVAKGIHRRGKGP